MSNPLVPICGLRNLIKTKSMMSCIFQTEISTILAEGLHTELSDHLINHDMFSCQNWNENNENSSWSMSLKVKLKVSSNHSPSDKDYNHAKLC